MTEAEKNEIVGLVMTQISSQAVDFDIATEQPQANDLLTAVRETESGGYRGVTIKWDDVARIATEVANRAAERAEQAETDANNILERVQSKGTEITNFVATSKTEIETQKNESVNAVRSVYQSDLNELKGDLVNRNTYYYDGDSLLKDNDHSSLPWTGDGNTLYVIGKVIPQQSFLNRIKSVNVYVTNNTILKIGVGHFDRTDFVVDDFKVFNCITGKNTFDVDISINKNYDSFIFVWGALLKFGNTSTQYKFYQATTSTIETGGRYNTSLGGNGEFGVSVSFETEKNSISKEIKDATKVKKSYQTLFYQDMRALNEQEFTYNNCNVTENGTVMSGVSHFNTSHILGIDDFIYYGIFQLTDAQARFGIATLGEWKSKYILDMPNRSLSIYTNGTDNTPIQSFDVSSIGFAMNEFYKISITRYGWKYVLSLTRLSTMDTISFEFENYKNTTDRNYCRCNGYFGAICETGTTTCTEIRILINNKNSKCLFIGDSLIEGDQVENKDRWTIKAKNDLFNENAIIDGIGGSYTYHIKNLLNAINDYGVKYDYCVVLAGMNERRSGGTEDFITNINSIYNAIIANGAVPIICINPIPSQGTNYIEEQRDYILSKGWQTVRFDLAFNSNGSHNPSLFNADGTHPNANGNAVMYDELKKVMNILTN